MLTRGGIFIRNPRIRFADEPTEEGTVGGDLGFPTGTSVADMTAEQQAAYWRHESKKQQRLALSRIDPAEHTRVVEERDQLRSSSQTDTERELEQAREEARREGENIGAARYLKDAVMGRFQALTGKTDAEVATTFQHVDPASFTDANGEIDAEKLTAFAATFGVPETQPTPIVDPIRVALERQRRGGEISSSVAEKRKQTRESLIKTNA
jgi:hypothetical protein